MARTILERKTWSCELQAHALLTCAFYFEPSRAGAVLMRIGCGGRFYFEPSRAGAVLIRIGCGGRFYFEPSRAGAVLIRIGCGGGLYCQRTHTHLPCGGGRVVSPTHAHTAWQLKTWLKLLKQGLPNVLLFRFVFAAHGVFWCF